MQEVTLGVCKPVLKLGQLILDERSSEVEMVTSVKVRVKLPSTFTLPGAEAMREQLCP